MAPKRTATPLDGPALHKRYKDATEEMASVYSLIAGSLQQLDEREHAWQALHLRVQQDTNSVSDMVTLNVGGRIFATTMANLLRFEGSYFHAMLASGQWKPESDGAYFIDLNPKQFDRVLDYLRTGVLSFDGLRSDQMKQLRMTMDYLLLNQDTEEPIKLKWDPLHCGRGIDLSGEDRVATNGMGLWRPVQSTSPCTRFTVRVVQGNTVMVGFAPRAGFRPATATYNTCGWYLYVRSGKLYSQDGVCRRAYSAAVAMGSRLTAVLARQSGSISFEVDGRSLGIAYSDIPAGDMYATVCICSGSVALEDE